jgi:DNA-binding MarR family transcriptional regulator
VVDRGERVYGIVRLVRPMTLNAARAIEPGLRDHGLTVGMRAVLEVVFDGGPMTVPQAARVLDVSRQAAQRLVTDLHDAGHIQLTANPRHQRSRLVEITPHGTHTFASLRAEETRRLSALAPELSDTDLEAAQRVMSALSEAIRRTAQAARLTITTTRAIVDG